MSCWNEYFFDNELNSHKLGLLQQQVVHNFLQEILAPEGLFKSGLTIQEWSAT